MTDDQWKAWLSNGPHPMSAEQYNIIIGLEQSMNDNEYLKKQREFESARQMMSEHNQMAEMEL